MWHGHTVCHMGTRVSAEGARHVARAHSTLDHTYEQRWSDACVMTWCEHTTGWITRMSGKVMVEGRGMSTRHAGVHA